MRLWRLWSTPRHITACERPRTEPEPKTLIIGCLTGLSERLLPCLWSASARCYCWKASSQRNDPLTELSTPSYTGPHQSPLHPRVSGSCRNGAVTQGEGRAVGRTKATLCYLCTYLILALQQLKLTDSSNLEHLIVLCVQHWPKMFTGQPRDWPLLGGSVIQSVGELQVPGSPGQLKVLPLLHDTWVISLLCPLSSGGERNSQFLPVFP